MSIRPIMRGFPPIDIAAAYVRCAEKQLENCNLQLEAAAAEYERAKRLTVEAAAELDIARAELLEAAQAPPVPRVLPKRRRKPARETIQ